MLGLRRLRPEHRRAAQMPGSKIVAVGGGGLGDIGIR
jgi:hypothetical protein